MSCVCIKYILHGFYCSQMMAEFPLNNTNVFSVPYSPLPSLNEVNAVVQWWPFQPICLRHACSGPLVFDF